ncbi:hypothetical protein K2Q00_01615 [Patescibacteria group bacterium]|nr:hypothetical protein [Patescibacteria group bacterium]
MQELSKLCVSANQVLGWCDHKVGRVLWAVIAGTDLELCQTLENIALKGGIMSNFLPLPFDERSVPGQRLVQVWERIREAHPNSEIARTFVWKFWRPDEDSADAHMIYGARGEAPISYTDALARAYAAAEVQLH